MVSDPDHTAELKKQSDALEKLIDQGKELQRKGTDLIKEIQKAGEKSRKIERRRTPR